MRDQVRAAVAEITGREPSDVRQLGGGDTAAAFAVRLNDGATVFAKTAPETMPGVHAVSYTHL